MQHIAEYLQVFMLLYLGMAGHEAFEEFARHQYGFVLVVTAFRVTASIRM